MVQLQKKQRMPGRSGRKGWKMAGYLIKETTCEERKQIVEEALGNLSASCDGCMAGLADMYQDYIDGKKEIRDINMEFNARYERGDMDREERRSCPMSV